MTSADVMDLRAEIGFRSPLQPLVPGERWVMFAQRGTYEFGLHVDDAFRALVQGIDVFGKRLPCVLVDALPMLNGLQVRAQDPDREMGFVQA